MSESGHHRTRTGLLQGVCGREVEVDDGVPSDEDPLQVANFENRCNILSYS